MRKKSDGAGQKSTASQLRHTLVISWSEETQKLRRIFEKKTPEKDTRERHLRKN